ncbi:AfsR/SARP family transcriptional regulator [Phytomonospora endophytica]|uniref:DNA-binding SARP family transcriptional activator/tetratricopeptide (TPR) repeat protein n=1 Tax=Phytomonospora endophytica TaxID=714109 RepID=A0A841FYM4_9ACTN|nr:AfsR/SARP family transcriptional regulator [Phytomonospora endophytica]MBB6038622.1 DNA-binding SARP family transcriptional activator/tetratricopeptide (TPR) repeat protein [Phytomonospora endophytica]GIG69234.1 SARP family transcriptional regulator [Phytomonospora endophytica]
MDRVQIRLLGPVDVVVDGAVRPVSGQRRKAVLAVLALQAGDVVSTERLIDLVWDGRPPATAVNTLQSHISYLRGVLRSKAAIVARPPGYVLALGPDSTDVGVAERLVRQGTAVTEPARTAASLRAALDLWRARPLADLAGSTYFDDQAVRLELAHLSALESLFDARLAMGEHGAVVAELERLVRENPFRERLHAQLMIALYRSGRQTDALTVYRCLRKELDDHFGIDPSPELRELEVALLRHDGALAAPATVAAAAPDAVPRAAAAPVPGQLPSAVRAFAGRRGPLRWLDEVMTGLGRDPGAGSEVVVLVGSAGVGKTSLAVHWAHKVAARFPDGQLYINLRGFDPGGPAMTPAEALRRFLDALGVPPEWIPASLDAQAALYRSVLAGRRVLVVLDNAADTDQVRHLLPGSPGCLVLVTSRSRLVPLVVTEGARALHLDLMPPAEARELLAGRLGTTRVAAEPDVVDRIIAHCGRLPLALAIAAGRVLTDPALALSELARELSETPGRLTHLDGGDAATSVRQVFAASYRALADRSARFFRLLGLHFGPDITAAAAGNLAGVPVADARRLLAELCHAHLLVDQGGGRYAFHDLLRLFAVEQTEGLDPAAERRAAVGQLLDYYLHSACGAAVLLNPTRARIEPIAASEEVSAEDFTTSEEATAWFAEEHLALFAAVECAPVAFDAHRWRLLWALMPFVSWRGRWPERRVLQSGVDATRRLGDLPGEVEMVRCLGIAADRLDRNDEAEEYFTRALQLSEKTGDLAGRARGHSDVSSVIARLGRPEEALWHNERALELYEAAGHRVGQARVLNSIGWLRLESGQHDAALPLLVKALEMHQELGDLHGGSIVRDSIGCVHCRRGEYHRAFGEFRLALAGFREFGDVYNEAETLTRLGDAHRDAGDLAAAQRIWRQALVIFDDLGHPSAEELRDRLGSRVS